MGSFSSILTLLLTILKILIDLKILKSRVNKSLFLQIIIDIRTLNLINFPVLHIIVDQYLVLC